MSDRPPEGTPDAAVVDDAVRAPGVAPESVDGNGAVSAKLKEKAARKAAKHLPGEEGTWIFIFGDMTVFALLFGVYLVRPRGRSRSVQRVPGAPQPELGRGQHAAAALTSSLFVVTAIRAIRNGIPNIAPKLVAGAFACGVGFAVVKYFEWGGHLSDGFKPATNDFWMYYYVLTGLHFFHLLIGMGLLVFIFFQARKVSVRRICRWSRGASPSSRAPPASGTWSTCSGSSSSRCSTWCTDGSHDD